jgi:acyloxyacyl hydrolase
MLIYKQKSIFKNHTPGVDLDDDGHSTIPVCKFYKVNKNNLVIYFCFFKTFRGTSWKGKDCDDLNPKVRPGVKPIGNDIAKDTNCNGIYVHIFCF